MLTATWTLYRDAAGDSIRGIRDSGWAVAFLFAAFVAMVVLSSLASLAGFAGGFLAGFLIAALCAWYLALLEIPVKTVRKVRFDDVRDNMGTYFNDTLTVLFLFFLPEFIIGLTMPELNLVLVPVACLVFNPCPEMIYQERSRGLELVGDAAKFMQANWPEWLIPNVVVGLLLAGIGWFTTGAFEGMWVLEAVKMFSPWFGFMSAGFFGLQLGGFTPLGIALFFGMFAFAHAFMVFRGNLYKRLRISSRRGRTWSAKL